MHEAHKDPRLCRASAKTVEEKTNPQTYSLGHGKKMTETVASSCPDCYSRTQGYPCIYNITCSECRTAIALAEPCKIIRKSMVESMERRWGEVKGWKGEPHCGCDKQCSRLKNMRETK